jgi:hypothetical protein
MSNWHTFQSFFLLTTVFAVASISHLFLPDFLPADAQNESSPPTASILNASNDTELNRSSSAYQYILFADLHLVQAIRDILDKNITGATDQLSLAQEQLEKVLIQ